MDNNPLKQTIILQTDDVMFSAIKALNRETFENPKVEDSEGKLITNPNEILKTVANHFENNFKDINTPEIPSFIGKSKPLNHRKTQAEIRKNLNRFKNNKAPGEVLIYPELLKYSTPLLDQTIANILNSTFTNHEELDINSGVLIAIPKPGKPKGPPNNLRPITLLNTLRKVLSLITLDRISPSIEKYLSYSQSGFRPERSTSDVVWTHRWLAAKTVTENINIKITRIDMSATFDTIDRDILLQILKNIVEEDELRLMQFLLSNTHINTRINNADINAPFTSNVGTPQGDGLSPVLFTIYLEHALKEVRSVIGEPKSPLEEKIPRETAYADDVDFVGLEYIDIDAVQTTLRRYNLKVNIDKTKKNIIKQKRGCLEINEEGWLADG